MYPEYDKLAKCPGYKASNVKTSATGLTATLTLAGAPCNVYGDDLRELRLEVSYETDSRLHVKIQDPANNLYQVPASVFPARHPKDHAVPVTGLRPQSGSGLGAQTTAPMEAGLRLYSCAPRSSCIYS